MTQPLYCPKSDVEIGYVEISLYRQEKHGFYREVIWDQVSKVGLFFNGEPFGLSWKRLEGNAFKGLVSLLNSIFNLYKRTQLLS